MPCDSRGLAGENGDMAGGGAWSPFGDFKSSEGPPRKAPRCEAGARTKTDTGRRGAYPKALERTLVKELGKLTP